MLGFFPFYKDFPQKTAKKADRQESKINTDMRLLSQEPHEYLL